MDLTNDQYVKSPAPKNSSFKGSIGSFFSSESIQEYSAEGPGEWSISSKTSHRTHFGLWGTIAVVISIAFAVYLLVK